MRRHLGYTPKEVDAMSWWETQMFVEGLVEEFGSDDDTGSAEGSAGEGELGLRDVSYTPDVHTPTRESSLDELAGLGMRTRKVG